MLNGLARRTRVVLVFVGTLVVLAAVSLLVPIYGEICTENQYTGHKDCAAYHMVFVALWHLAKPFSDWSAGITAIATVAIGAFTWTLWRATTEQGRLTVRAINGAQDANQRGLRAYLSVTIGVAAYQDRTTNTKFAGHPTLKNNGRTPAYKVRIWTRAEIIPDTLVDKYTFAVVPTDEVSQATIGPGEDRILTCVVPSYVNDADIAKIKKGDGTALWAWGTVRYEDAFKTSRYVNFSQKLVWLDNKVFGVYGQRFADSD
jgi:hypothetical protein